MFGLFKRIAALELEVKRLREETTFHITYDGYGPHNYGGPTEDIGIKEVVRQIMNHSNLSLHAKAPQDARVFVQKGM